MRESSVPNDASSMHENSAYFFHKGTSRRAYEYLGAHRERERFVFRVWAPHADAVWVCGDFCNWNPTAIPMKRITEHGVWEATVDPRAIREGQTYKYRIQSGERELYKADPYGTCMQKPPETASVICDIEGYRWRDAGWLRYRKAHFTREQVSREPINVYEVHLGSWASDANGATLSYPQLACELASYVKQMGFTHVELLPVSEHPYDASLGYQVCGFYAPTARYGTPKEFMSFVDTFHEAGIGVILDWVPGHFPKDAHGLYEFDGQPLYEYREADRIEVAATGERRFDVGREEVRSFLLSNAIHWIEHYHVDGLRIASVDSMLYLDYGKRAGEWKPNEKGSNECIEAIEFFRTLNTVLASEYPDVLTVAESYPGGMRTVGFANGGLGFSLRRGLGWVRDSMQYIEKDPLWRKYDHERLISALSDLRGESSILPISHDEVSGGRGSLAGKLQGEERHRLAGARLFLAYLMTQPGKKLLFMGSELGLLGEWDHRRVLEWYVTDREQHASFQQFSAELFHLYLEQSPLWELDASDEGFAWIDPCNSDLSVYSYRRIDADGKELLILLNFTPVMRASFRLELEAEGVYEEILNTDARRFGGDGTENVGALRSIPDPSGESRAVLALRLPPLSAIVLRKREP